MEEQYIKTYFINNELILNKILDDYYNYINRILINTGITREEDIEEIMSDILFILWKNRNKLDKNLKFSPYIAGITKNLAYKKIKVDSKFVFTDIDENEYISDFNIEDLLERKEINDFIIGKLQKYSEIDTKIFEMFYIEDKSIKQISKITGLSKTNVKTKLHRIRKKLKEIIKVTGYKY